VIAAFKVFTPAGASIQAMASLGVARIDDIGSGVDASEVAERAIYKANARSRD
jgi:hypothetical protein